MLCAFWRLHSRLCEVANHTRKGESEAAKKRRASFKAGHASKSHAVVAKEGNKTKLIRFGQKGVSGSPPRKGESEANKKRRASFKARHAKNIAKGKMSAAYWADRCKW